jgi:type II secretory pathway pseudopilin PulG
MAMRKRHSSRKGMTMIEAVVATGICGTVLVTLAAMAAASISQSKNQGQSVSQATALAAQKLDQLMTMQYTSASTAAPLVCASSPCGSLTSDTTNYVEYLDNTGNVLSGVTSSTTAGVYFTRRWQITTSTPTSTSILVQVYVVGTGVGVKSQPTASMACIKAQQ